MFAGFFFYIVAFSNVLERYSRDTLADLGWIRDLTATRAMDVAVAKITRSIEWYLEKGSDDTPFLLY